MRDTSKEKAECHLEGWWNGFFGWALKSENYCKGGVRLIVNKKWSPNILSYKLCSSRVRALFQFDSHKAIKIVQVCAATSTGDDDEAGEFYHDHESTLAISSTYTAIVGDFNAKLNKGGSLNRSTSENLELENKMKEGIDWQQWGRQRGWHYLVVGNNFFRRQAKPWMYLDCAKRKVEEQNRLYSDRYNGAFFLKDVSVLPSFSTGSDHRLLRAIIFVILVVEKRIHHTSFWNKRTLFLEGNSNFFKYWWTMEGDIDEVYEKFVTKIFQCMKVAARCSQGSGIHMYPMQRKSC